MSPEPTEEARQLAEDWLYGRLGTFDTLELEVDSLARLLDLVAMKTAAEAQR